MNGFHQAQEFEDVENQEFILESCYPKSPVPKLSTKSACQLLLKSAETIAENELIENWMTNSVTGETIKFKDVNKMTEKVASFMNKKGMEKGDVALYMTSDVTKIYPTILGGWRLGCIWYSSYPEDTTETLTWRIKEAKAKWVFCDYFSIPQVKAACASVDWSVEIVVVLGPAGDCTSINDIFQDDGEACPAQVVATELDDPILVLCTSGTTGKSKGAVYTNRSVLAFCLGTNTIPRSNKPEMKLLRVTHVLGLLFPLRNLYRGSWAIMMHQVTKENIFKAVDTYKPVMMFGFPTFLVLLALDPEAQKYDRSSLEVTITGGMTMTKKFYDAMMTLPNMKHVFNGYGLTECGALTTTIDLSGTLGYSMIPDVPPLSVGRLYPNTSLRVLDMDSGKPVGPNQKGEFSVRSPILCSGYWKREEETRDTFQQGWMRTGDMGYYDENGFVYIVDRIKETFKYFNNHISPAEVEEIILLHPQVAECSVIGIPDPDGGDHIPRAVVVLKPGSSAVSSDSIRAFADEKLAEYKKLRGGVFIVDQLPKGKTGKIMKSLVQTMPLSTAA